MFANIYLIPRSLSSCFSQPKETSSPFRELANLNDLAKFLTSEGFSLDQWMTWKNEIKAFIEQHAKDHKQLDAFFAFVTDWGMERNPQKMLAILVEIASLDLLTRAVSARQPAFTNIFDLAAENAKVIPKVIDTSLKTTLSLEWKRFCPTILYFIPNVINIFLGAFNFLDVQKRYTTLWDKYLVLEILVKFCLIPYFLVKSLQPIFGTTAKVYAIAALIIAGVGVLMSCYQRFRPLPDEIVNCTNLSKQIRNRVFEPKVGQAAEMDELIDALEADFPVILIGLSGEGKTALVHQFIQKQQDKQSSLSKELRSLCVYQADAGLMVANGSFNHAELCRQTKEPIEGLEKQVLLFFDEFQQIINNANAFDSFKTKFLVEKPSCKCIIAVTPDQWKMLQNVDLDRSFRRRMKCIEMQSPDREQIRKIIKSLEYGFAPDVPVSEDGIQAIIEYSTEQDYLPKIGVAAKVDEIFRKAVGLCKAAYNKRSYDVELNKEQLVDMREKIWKIKKIVAHQQKIKMDHARLNHRLASIIAVEDHFEDPEINMNHLEKVDILANDYSHGKKMPSLSSKESFNEKEKIMYLWYNFYAIKSIQKILDREIAKIDPRIPLQLDRRLVKHVYQNIRKTEEGNVKKGLESEEKKGSNE